MLQHPQQIAKPRKPGGGLCLLKAGRGHWEHRSRFRSPTARVELALHVRLLQVASEGLELSSRIELSVGFRVVVLQDRVRVETTEQALHELSQVWARDGAAAFNLQAEKNLDDFEPIVKVLFNTKWRIQEEEKD